MHEHDNSLCNNWYEMKMLDDRKSASIYIYEEIGKNWLDNSGVTAKSFINDLKDLGSIDVIELHINSPGGAVFDGVAVYNVLCSHPATVKVTVDGMAASIASVIAMAGDTITMNQGSMMMVHSPAQLLVGRYRAEDLKQYSEGLERIEESITGIYQARTGLSRFELSRMLAKETYLTADEAVELGFADKVGEEMKIAASLNMGDVSMAMEQQAHVLELIIKDAEISELKSRLAILHEQVPDLSPAEVNDLVSLCADHGFTAQLPKMIEDRLSLTAAESRVKEMSAWQGVLVAAGLEESMDEILSDFGDRPKALGRALVQLASELDVDINSTFLPGAESKSFDNKLNREEIYASRQGGRNEN